jgi:hypothetical protein
MGFQRKYLSADGLIEVVRHSLRRENLPVVKGSEYSWEDCVMSGLAIFGFKCPSLLQFEKRKTEDQMIRRNLRTLYGIKKAPSDTCLRERLDRLSPKQFRRPFKKIFAHLQRGKALEGYRYVDGHYIVSLDGTGQYSSDKVHCQNCCEKKHRHGEVSYYHQMLGAVLVHPEKKVVIPLAPEPIVKGDGDNKNDCERNASKRLLVDLRREHPHLKLLVVEDGLASNYPHLSLLDSLNMQYVIGVKPGDHAYLFDWIKALKPTVYHRQDQDGQHTFCCYSDVPLNETHHDYLVNVIEYTVTRANGKTLKFTWVTRMPIKTEKAAYQLMRAARARWRIENETFNTLKNQGYQFEHNYGHGDQNLCSVFTMLMMLAFLIDQVQQLCCKHYQKAREREGTFDSLFEFVRSLIRLFVWNSFQQIWVFIGDPGNRVPPVMTV